MGAVCACDEKSSETVNTVPTPMKKSDKEDMMNRDDSRAALMVPMHRNSPELKEPIAQDLEVVPAQQLLTTEGNEEENH